MHMKLSNWVAVKQLILGSLLGFPHLVREAPIKGLGFIGFNTVGIQ